MRNLYSEYYIYINAQKPSMYIVAIYMCSIIRQCVMSGELYSVHPKSMVKSGWVSKWNKHLIERISVFECRAIPQSLNQ